MPQATLIDAGAATRRKVVSILEDCKRELEGWLRGPSKSFTRLCATEEGETFTRAEVLMVNLGALAVLSLAGVLTWIAEGGAL